MQIIDTKKFQSDLLGWYDNEKRDLPWRRERDPYRIWVSEIMLQQTKVDTVIPYYERFLTKFPTLDALAEADEEEVLKVWEGLGYYSRARNLHQAVKEVRDEYGGVVPSTEKEIATLKGVGPYTAGAVLSIAYDVPAPAVDGNVMRVLSRIFSIYDDIAKPASRKKFEAITRDLLPEERAGDYTQALMELGAVVCVLRSPACLLCPVAEHCSARKEGVQEFLPVKAKKKPPRSVQLAVGVVQDSSGRYLVEKRPDTGLLAGMWQFPHAEEGIEGLLETGREGWQSLTQIKHVFSHLVWEMDVYQTRHDIQSLTDRQALLTLDELKQKAFPVSHQKIIALLEE
ncbi:A/G-specific adenine glycosylase [Alkalicoccus luteus]|uniref:Adenine DNA glycosylase n=1 Tax=Alkalicoccus luteus TaxID=1237094 RepID=A0A969TVA9_9BACI|nr:A/G-specific adenine glycosylase [Alkalicoccus luteus]